MHVLALTTPGLDRSGVRPLGRARIGERQVDLASASVARPPFDPDHPDSRGRVLLHVEAFSANFRDKALCLTAADHLRSTGRGSISFLGSEFCGRVVQRGAGVEGLAVGDRVVGDGTYPRRSGSELLGGIVTNRASRGWLVLHESQVCAVPRLMGPDVAAAFALGAQTAQSMVRRGGVSAGSRVLVMSGRSNTSLFLAQCAAAAGGTVSVLSRGRWVPEHLDALPAGAEVLAVEGVLGMAEQFDVVLDPFFDLNVARALRALDYGGRYVTCGLQAQHPSFAEPAEPAPVVDVLGTAIVKNLSLIGNCIGERADLDRALALYEEGALSVRLDSVWGPQEGVAFLERTFSAPDRFGKVVMRYAA